MDPPPYIPQFPPELMALLDDPRLADMKDSPDPLAHSTRLLEPRDPPTRGESRYLLLRHDDGYDTRRRSVRWVNQPKGLGFLGRTGGGLGFSLVTERPQFHERTKKRAIYADASSYLGWWIASPAFVEILRQFDPEPIETVAIDWVFADGQRLDRYVFVDVRRLVHAYDYARTAVVVQMKKGTKYIGWPAHPRALKPDIDPAVHVFRDAFWRDDLFMSRALAKALADAGLLRGIRFEDPFSVATVEF